MVRGCGRRRICLEKMFYSSIWAEPCNSGVTEAGLGGSSVIGPRCAISTWKGRIPSGFGLGHVIPKRLKRTPARFGLAYVIPARLGRIPPK
ncbi:hypothetical protein L484_024585 [Morus notabilis]|uniref:Uncharacterized protein n=1 Tax=Morus notabilis TaxID=981085 RepID=W9RHS3_9ROSA|nr:hypothetical protein L484_024585 [Morus notabilis]